MEQAARIRVRGLCCESEDNTLLQAVCWPSIGSRIARKSGFGFSLAAPCTDWEQGSNRSPFPFHARVEANVDSFSAHGTNCRSCNNNDRVLHTGPIDARALVRTAGVGVRTS
jgi:hypothetical protein